MQISRVINKITVDGITYVCHGERKIVNGQSMYMFYRTPGIETDVILCPDPTAEGFELYSSLLRMTTIPGTTNIKTDKAFKYLTFVAEEENSSISFEYDVSTGLEYSLNGGEWNEYDSEYQIDLTNIGDFVSFRSMGNENLEIYEMYTTIQGLVAAYGDITSIINGVGGDCPTPANEEVMGGFVYMFDGCNGLTKAPNLPSTTLTPHCYDHMFSNCSALTTAPELPATTLTLHCYDHMFANCTSLTTAPELPATTLAESCYLNMFSGCTALTTAPELPATTLANYCYQAMFGGCTSLTTAPELSATTLSDYCYCWMFFDCTSLTAAPELPATELVTACYNNMFNGCTSLEYVKALFLTDPKVDDSYPYTNTWLENVSEEGTFVMNSAAEWDTDDKAVVPSGWTVQTYDAVNGVTQTKSASNDTPSDPGDNGGGNGDGGHKERV